MIAIYSVLGAFGIIWIAGSIVITVMRPWRCFDGEDRWLAWALIIGWWMIALATLIELALERYDARSIDGR